MNGRMTRQDEFRFDFAQSDRDFRKVVWPQISREWGWLKGYRLLPRDEQNQILGLLDRDANIDYLAKRDPGGLVGIASRCQRQIHRTFTIRLSRKSGAATEWEKTRKAISDGTLTAGFQVQAYLTPDGKDLVQAFGVRLTELYDHAELGGRMQVNGEDGNTFLFVDVDWLRGRGVAVYECSFDVKAWSRDVFLKHHPDGIDHGDPRVRPRPIGDVLKDWMDLRGLDL